MKTKIEELQRQLLGQISNAAREGKLGLVAEYSPYASQVEELFVRLIQLEQDAEMIAQKLSELNQRPPTNSQPTPSSVSLLPQDNRYEAEMTEVFGRRKNVTVIEVKIDWAKNGQTGGVETIKTGFASDTLVKLFESLASRFGEKAFHVGSTIQINRGPFLSKNPQSDFPNRTKGGLYAHRPVGKTGWFVLTHSETSEKVEDVTVLLSRIGLKPGSYSVKPVAR